MDHFDTARAESIARGRQIDEILADYDDDRNHEILDELTRLELRYGGELLDAPRSNLLKLCRALPTIMVALDLDERQQNDDQNKQVADQAQLTFWPGFIGLWARLSGSEQPTFPPVPNLGRGIG